MTPIISPDSKFYAALAGWTSLVFAGLLWAIACLPVITIFAATRALFASVRQLREEERAVSVRAFIRHVRVGWRDASTLGALLLGGWGFVVLALLGASPLVRLVAIPAIGMWALVSAYALPVLEERDGGAIDALKTAYVRVATHPGTALMGVVIAACILVAPLLVPATVVVPFVVSAVGGATWMVSAACNRARSIPTQS